MKIKNVGSRAIEASCNSEFILIRPGKEGEVSENLYCSLMDSDYGKSIVVIKSSKPEMVIPPLTAFPKIEIPTADINFVCTLWASNGMGRVGEEELLVLDELGYKINVIPQILEKSGLKPRTLELLEKKYNPSEVTLFYAVPEVILKYKTKINYLHIDWDTTKCPKIWSDIINEYITKVFASSDFTKNALIAGGVKVPVEIAKHGVLYKDFPYLERTWEGTFNFVTSGDLSTRKGTDVLLEAFCEAFPNKEDVRLIIKSNHTLNWGKLTLPKDDRVEIILDRLSPKLYLDLLKKSHCFVFPSRAEGFGLPPLEAMSTGMPTIVHNWSALTSMADIKYCYVVEPSGRNKAEPYLYPNGYGDIGDWGEPDKMILIDTLRYIYEHRNEAEEKGKLASAWVKEEWGWRKPIRKMIEDIMNKERPSWGEFYKEHLLTKDTAQGYNEAHKELFWLVRGFYPKTVIESGTGQGGMAAWLTWKDQKLNGIEPTPSHAEKVIAVDNDEDVLKLAKINMRSLGGKAEVADANIFDDETKADVIFSQGVLEHFSDDELKRLIDSQLKQAPILIHSVPNNDYGKLDYGNERLLPDEYYYKLFEQYDLTVLRYWNEYEIKKQTLLVFKRKPEPIKVSIIMLCWNLKEMTIKAIKCVKKHTNKKDYELIVIDNGSTDGISEWLDQQEGIRVLHTGANIGVPTAKNIGMALSYGEYVCYLDNDTEVGDGWLDTMLNVFKDPSVGFTAHEGYMINIPQKWFNAEKVKTGLMQWSSGSCFLFKRKLIKKVGMLIDRDKWCIEDVDYCFKIRNLGYRAKLPDKPVNIIHLGGTTAKKFSLYSDIARFRELSMRVWNDWEPFILKEDLGAKIDVGSGDNPYPNYLHVDIQDVPGVDFIAEASKLPFLDNTIEDVRNSHLIEHLEQKNIDKYISEWNRVLEVGGSLRIICPDFLSICKAVAEGKISVEQGTLWMFGGKRTEFDYHKWNYTAESLIPIFERNGFVDVHKEENSDGWLQVVGKKSENRVKGSPTICFYNGHHHVFGGGENLAFRTIEILQKTYPNTYIMSEDSTIDPKQAFGINIVDKRTSDQNFDIFINYSHGKLMEPKGKKNIAFILYPEFDFGEVAEKYDLIVTQSKFAQKAIKDKWGLDSVVIYPPSDIKSFYSMGRKKKKQILCVGRFINKEGVNNKNQEILVDTFKKLKKGWKLIFIGCKQDVDYYNKVYRKASKYNIEFKEGVSVEEMRKLYAESEILWHAAGYNAKNQSEYEHFGMVSVEALASECRVLAYGEGGIIEVNGVESWHTVDELVELTEKSPALIDPLNKPDLTPYSIEEAERKWKKIINEYR